MKPERVNISREFEKEAYVEVTYGQEDTVPASLEQKQEWEDSTGPAELDNGIDYPAIQTIIDNDWGTVRLKEFLEDLLLSDQQQQQFPAEFSASLLRLAIANDRAIEKRGVDLEEYSSQFMSTGWKLPKNF